MSSIFGDGGSVEDLAEKNFRHMHELPSDDEDNQETDDVQGDNAESVAIKVEPKKRVHRNPRVRLTVETLSGPRGLQTIEEYFKDIKFKGKGYEKHDLDEVMRRLQHWGHRMFPTYKFGDVLSNIDRLSRKKPLQVHMSRYRLGLVQSTISTDENNGEVQDGGDYNEEAAGRENDEPFDEFDALLDEQIAISKLAPRTPAANSHRGHLNENTPMTKSTLTTPSFSRGNVIMSTPYGEGINTLNDSDLAQPLPLSQPSTPAPSQQLSSEQLARIAENRRLAQERLRAKQLQNQQPTVQPLPDNVTEV